MTDNEAPAPKAKRTKTPKEEAVQVTVKLTENLRQKLLDLNKEHSTTARYDLPLTATVALAIEIAHEAYFPDGTTDGVSDSVNR